MRIILLVSCLIMAVFFAYLNKQFLLTGLFLFFSGLQFHVFQFFHFTMVEVMASLTIMLSIGFGHQYIVAAKQGGKRLSRLVYASLFLYATFLLKVQFVYILPLSLVYLALAFYHASNRSQVFKRDFPVLLLVIGAPMGLFYLFWYSPNQEFFDLVLAHQGQGRFPLWGTYWSHFLENGSILFWNSYTWIFSLLFLITIPIGLFQIFRRPFSELKVFLVLIGAWLLLESHKTLILWIPTRYAISFFVAQGLWMAVVVTSAFKENSKRSIRLVSISITALLIIANIFNLNELFTQRSFHSQEMINSLKNVDFKGQKVTGVWATNLVWNSSAYVIPVWKGFLNDEDVIEKHHPLLISTQIGDEGSNSVYSNRGYNLLDLSDSVGVVSYGRYKVNVFFMPIQ